MTTQEVVAATSKSNEVKQEEKKTKAKGVKSIKLIDCVDVILQSVMIYTYIGNST
jgi:hypothetical protein